MEQWEILLYGGFNGQIIYKTEVLIGQFPMNGGYDGKLHLSTKVFIGQSSIKFWIFMGFPYFPSPCWHHPRVNPWPRGIPSFVAMRTKSGENFKSTRSTAGSPQFPSDMKRGWGGKIHIEYKHIIYIYIIVFDHYFYIVYFLILFLFFFLIVFLIIISIVIVIVIIMRCVCLLL